MASWMSASSLQLAASMNGFGPPLLQLRVLLLHAVLGGVIAERHVARQRAHDLERAVELVSNRRRHVAGARRLQTNTTL